MSQQCPRCQRTLDLPAPAAFCPYCGQPLGATAPSTADAGSHDVPPTRPPDVTPSGDPDETVSPPPGGWTSLSVRPFVPERLGGYRLLRRLGQGGMGTVYEGEHETTGRRVAVKVVDVQASDDALRRFRQEGKLASAVSHPRCVFVLAVDEEGGRPFIVLELMPGRTLDDLVRERGPLPVGEAIAHALDLIEGLEQVHALGVIHRDIKPSNSFLDAQGRVKVGDFGLARSLQPEAKLTRTGTFIGTPLFASPEQIKGEALDGRADLYSVCATLYFLLTGSAPHSDKGGDALALLARVVSDDAPPVRSRRADVPAGLERALARGLSRDRERRFPDLASLRAELEAFRGTKASIRLPLTRFAAFLLDSTLSGAVMWALAFARGVNPLFDLPGAPEQWLSVAAHSLYFWLCEGLLGYTPGKKLLGLRVWRGGDVGRPGLKVALARTASFEAFLSLPSLLLGLFYPMEGDDLTPTAVHNLVLIAGAAVMLCTMRRSNGYRCLHDLLSGTRVVAVPQRVRGVRYPTRPSRSEARPLPQPLRVGRFRVEGELWRRGDERVLLAVDPGLDRAVWLWLRPRARPEVSAARRESASEDRPRWLACGDEGADRWDAFLVPSGAPLVDAVAARGARPWEDARPVLLDLAEKLEGPGERALGEGFSLSRVWLTPSGRVVLVDLPITEEEPLNAEDVLADAAVVLLEGEAPAPGRSDPPRGLLPGHARRALQGLPRFGGARGVGWVRERLDEAEGKPTSLSRPARLLHLGLLAALQVCCCGGPFVAAFATGLHIVAEADEHLRQGARVLSQLDGHSATCAAALTAPAPSPLTRLAPAFEFDALQRERPGLARAVADLEAYRDGRYSRLSAPLRAMENHSQEQARERPTRRPPPFLSGGTRVADEAAIASAALEAAPKEGQLMVVLTLGLMGAPLGVFVLSAFAFRGGVRYPLANVEVVRRDGQPAARFRCAWRALLAWLPIVAVLALARLVEEGYWALWTPEGGPAWLLMMADACWVAAVAVALACILVIVWTPARSLHDRLAGTWLVPR